MPDLEPITREEMLLDGQDLEPITRKEMFIKRIYDKTQVIPEPITREEMFLKKAGEGGSDVDIEQLNVSENGTYSESGKAYSPVIVNVPAPPLPDNAYLLKEVEGLPSDIATFSDGANLPMPSLKVSIEPIQSGSGDPSPTNIRPISGWDEINVNVSGVNVWDEEWESGGLDSSGNNIPDATRIRSKNYISIIPMVSYFFTSSPTIGLRFYDKNKTCIAEQVIRNAVFTTPSEAYYMRFTAVNTTTYNHDISINYPSTDTEYHAYNGHTYTIQLGDTYYGGKLDVVSGVLTVDRAYVDLGTLDWQYSSISERFYVGASDLGVKAADASTPFNAISSALTAKSYNEIEAKTVDYAIVINPNATQLFARYSSITSASDFKTAMNGVQLVYELATPIEIQLTPTQVNSLEGVNNISANSGKIINGQYFSKGE